MKLELAGKTCTLQCLRTILGDLDDWELQAMIEDGRLCWAIDVASPSGKARELRIPLPCVQDFQAGIKRDLTAEEVGSFMFGNGPLVRARTFYRALNIKHSHFYDLMREGCIRLARGSKHRRGPGGGGSIPWLEAINFLTIRRVL